jgi:predicted nucleic acid-binding protein
VIVVSNASPLISLSRVGQLDLLRELFGQISIAKEVEHETVGADINRPGVTAIQNAGWIRVHAIRDAARLQQWQRSYRLGSGELATVILAQEVAADLAIIDERAARLLAVQHNLRVIGCVGILEVGYQRGKITDLRRTYLQLLSAGTYIDRAILNRSLAAFNLPSL